MSSAAAVVPTKKRNSTSTRVSAVKDKDTRLVSTVKRKSKKWSKDKARQKQKELDGQVNDLYAAMIPVPSQPIGVVPTHPDSANDMITLENTLRSL